ncbi:hypothetical protein [Desulfobulbus alkaliphilus]|uniref:hypothetical protein n=1 Tax=Desulfobulbus alkaliphilus TaxID=869814 RepID=UPI001964EA9F|nr:hypothetical protein [Desulfobulbus alkaliphilus]MBM9536330.1 hypothetical protein [Desulfobulbus alkaliphilus]
MNQVPRYVRGQDPDRDAWLTNFFTENHLAYEAYPDMVASPEQLKFMVHLDEEDMYYPCSDELFNAIMEKRADTTLTSAYIGIWTRLEKLVHEVVIDSYKQRYLLSLLTIKFNHEIAHKVQLPGRVEKRLLGIFTTISEIDRPLAVERELENKRAAAFLQSDVFDKLFNSPQGLDITDDSTLTEIDLNLHLLKLRRLLLLSAMRPIWRQDDPPDAEVIRKVINAPFETPEWEWFCNWLRDVISGRRRPCILWVGGRSGEIVFDIAILRILMKIGIKVILAVKVGFFYHRVSFVDLLEDPVLNDLLEDADVIADAKISKNQLLRHLDSENRLLVISDGTREPFNPLLTSVTYARAFKEADLVVFRNPGGRETITNHFQFTRDILSIVPGDDGQIDILLKPHHPKAVRFSRDNLRRRAEALIDMTKREKAQGKAIMFYSAIVGSIPGQLKTAKEILNIFVEHLRSSLNDVVIINPGEHFVEGMDADDIMYMWEIFQRSGSIDIWRFQSVDDVVKSFELMGRKVPPEWTGKDATYSTGCTKEMEIAMQIQKQYPEMQLIGPPYEKFQRRKEYGVGKLYDRTLAGSE